MFIDVSAPRALAFGILLAVGCSGGGGSPDGSWLTFEANPLYVPAAQGRAAVFNIAATSTRSIHSANLAVIDRGNVLSGPATLTGLGGPGSFSMGMQTRSDLAIGQHSGEFEVRLCYDDPLVCSNRIEGSPWRLPYTVEVVDPSTFHVGAWERAGQAPFTDDYALGALGSTLVAVAAGFYSDVMETWVSADDGESWTPLASPGPTAFTRGFALASDGTYLYLSGGEALDGSSHGTGAFTSHVWRFDGATWAERTPAAPFGGRGWHSMVVANGVVYVLGGSADGYTLLGDVWKSEDGGTTWTSLGDVLPAGAELPCTVPWGTGMAAAWDGLWTSEDGTAWTRRDAFAAPYLRMTSHCAVLGGRLFLYGPAWTFWVVSSADLESWCFEPETPMTSYAAPGMAGANGRLFLLFGEGTSERPVYRTVHP